MNTSITQDDAQVAWAGRFFSVFGNTTRFQRFLLGLMAGLVITGAVASLLMPPGSITRAPKASLDLLASITVGSLPVMSVESEILPGIDGASAGPTVTQLAAALSYELDDVVTGNAGVPRVFMTSIPQDMSDIRETAEKKALFFKTVLPLVLKVNESLRADRARLISIRRILDEGKKPSAVDRLWLAMMSERYNVARDDITALLVKVDVIPPSMALAQAAAESGWGTSRFTREGNALFGQWTFASGHLVPEDRDDGKEHMIRRFSNLLESVSGYARNLNTNRAYREFRALRTKLRKSGKPLDGRVLMGKLHRYSERGVDYVNEIRSLISFNKLHRLDDARLSGSQSTPST